MSSILQRESTEDEGDKMQILFTCSDKLSNGSIVLKWTPEIQALVSKAHIHYFQVTADWQFNHESDWMGDMWKQPSWVMSSP